MGNGSTSDAPVVLDPDVAFFDIDIRRAVFAHGAELHQVAIGPKFAERKQQVQRSNHIVHLREHRMLAVDHRIRSGALFGEVNHRIRLEVFDHTGQKIVVVHVADKHLDGFPGELLPDAQPVRQGLNGRQGLRAHFEIPLPPQEIIHHGHRVSLPGQIERRGPATVTITA